LICSPTNKGLSRKLSLAAMLFVAGSLSSYAANSKTKLELRDVLLDVGFSKAQAKCPADVLASELSGEDMAFLTEVVKESVIEVRGNDSERKFNEPEKSYMLAEIVDAIPMLQFMSRIGSPLAPSESMGATTTLRLQNSITDKCDRLFENPDEGYYLTLEDGEMRFNKRADIEFDPKFYESPDGLAQCIKVFRNVVGGNPNEGFDENANVDDEQIADTLRATFLTAKLVERLGDDPAQAGKVLSQAPFDSDEKAEQKCRASFPDQQMLIFLTEQISNGRNSFIDDVIAVHAAESEQNRRQQ
jgi:hypothetical protein